MKYRVHFSDTNDTLSNRHQHRLKKGRYAVNFNEKNGESFFFAVGVSRCNTQGVGKRKLVIGRISLGPNR